MTRSDTLKRLAMEEGFDLVGVCAPDPSRHTDFLRAWIEDGRHGSMGYLARSSALERRADVGRILPEAGAVLIVAQNYHQEDPEGVPSDPSRGTIARYARGRDYHRVLRKALERVLRRFREIEGMPVPGVVYVDTGPILERELAQRAELGWFGRNTMLIDPRHGSYFFIGVLLLEVHVEPRCADGPRPLWKLSGLPRRVSDRGSTRARRSRRSRDGRHAVYLLSDDRTLRADPSGVATEDREPNLWV